MDDLSFSISDNIYTCLMCIPRSVDVICILMYVTYMHRMVTPNFSTEHAHIVNCLLLILFDDITI